MKTTLPLFAIVALLFSVVNQTTAQETRLLRSPAISVRHIAFSYGGDVWLADRDGKNVRRLTTHAGGEGNPHFSPDGKIVAYQMILPWEEEFRNYRGGQNNPIRLLDLKTYEQEALPWEGNREHNLPNKL